LFIVTIRIKRTNFAIGDWYRQLASGGARGHPDEGAAFPDGGG